MLIINLNMYLNMYLKVEGYEVIDNTAFVDRNFPSEPDTLPLRTRYSSPQNPIFFPSEPDITSPQNPIFFILLPFRTR
jgi:hypothetical protein